MKLYVNSRDELVVLELDKIAYMQADGNYTRIVYIEGMETIVALGLSKMEELIRKTMPREAQGPFARLGRSFIVNQNFLTHINVLKQRLTLSDCQSHSYTLDMPKSLLKAYKELLRKRFVAEAAKLHGEEAKQ